MNIAIIEKDHFEVAYALISLFDNGKNRITVFCEEESYTQLQSLFREKLNRYTWVVKKETESNRHFIRNMFRHFRQHSFDLLYFDTISDNFILYAHYLRQLPAERIVLTLHNINDFFRFNPSFSIRRLIRWLGKRKLIKTIDNFTVLSETMIEHLRSKLPASKNIFTIPGAFFDPTFRTLLSYQQGNIIQLTIPGSVDTRRRNYEIVFDLLKKAKLSLKKIILK